MSSFNLTDLFKLITDTFSNLLQHDGARARTLLVILVSDQHRLSGVTDEQILELVKRGRQP